MPTIRVEGTAIHYEETGGGPETLVLVHGAGRDAGGFIRQLEGLADSARVLAIDLPGHGRSGGQGRPTIDAYVAFVLAFLDACKLDRVVLGGHSMGGAIALAFALAHPERLRGVVLVGTGARLRVMPQIFELWEKDPEQAARFTTERAVSPKAPRALVDALVASGRGAPSVVIGDFRACDGFDVMARLGEIRVPTLVLCGTDDQLAPPKYAEFLREGIPGARLALIPDAGHYAHLEQGDEANDAIRAFLEAL